MSENYRNISELFGEDVFSVKVMKERLPAGVYANLKKSMETGETLDAESADVIANEMKDWAIEKGATHFTHWFQPLTGNTAEKHDSFISAPLPSGDTILNMSGKELIKGEPDASSFPSGGLRATFEARGYTIWDFTSPAFVRHDENGATLCIPTAFCSYTGETLDQKTPLLRSMEAINEQAVRLLHLLGYSDVKKVTANVGAEQEYFIIDRGLYLKRKDLIFTGRTLFGAVPPKGQELDDHYYGNIRPRIARFMRDVDTELWKLGVPAKTKHNEVAPAQHELACIYEEANVAADHNQIVMQTLKRVASRQGLRCLLHEKPFDGVNGSGKHNNWSLGTDTGMNLMDPGKNPHENKLFLLLLACILRAVDEHGDLLMESAVSVGNERRLGGNEAPPYIISVFLGDQLTDVVDQLINSGKAKTSKKGKVLKTGVSALEDFTRDATDRNRTSPFAFTGNKFEFRMVGSKNSIAAANTVLNTIAAEAIADACDEIEKSADREKAVNDLTVRLFKKHRRVVFNGNGYSEEWSKEAAKRGLYAENSFIKVVESLSTPKAERVFGRFNVLTKTELEAREEIKYELYGKDIIIEARAMYQMARSELLPAMVRYANILAETINNMKAASERANVKAIEKDLEELSGLIGKADRAIHTLNNLTVKAQSVKAGKEQAVFCREKLIPAMEKVRPPIDRAELIVDREIWPVPTYSDLMFEL